MPNDRVDAEITLSVDIGNTIETRVKGKDGEKKITKHMITQPKSYGPFKISVPKLDVMVYTLLKNNFTLLFAQTITAIGCRIITHDKQFFKDHKVGALKLESFFLSKQRQIETHGENTCVLDYVRDQCRGKRGFKTYNCDILKEEMIEYASDFPLTSTQELINWAKTSHSSNVSIHAYDATCRKLTICCCMSGLFCKRPPLLPSHR
ncbi:unnamed protein product [Porites lobata]|uniref:Uncharacterized protein n=1 Tax=Porites lobata TaxID=104759 RepID=A0ABN8QU15_9CNID|nr:unnamed protein product [Porites lobata]